jgi:outer membrane biosynthesis protein TonB
VFDLDWGTMPRIKVLIAFLVCITAVGLAQDGASPQSATQADNSQTPQVSASALTGMVEHKTLPQYPKEALLKGIQGDVVFNVLVDANGKIVHSEKVKGDPLLVAASKDALQDYRFHPYLVNGTPVSFDSQVGYRFAISNEGDATHGKVECMTTIP